MNKNKFSLQDNPTYQKGTAAFCKKNYAYSVELFKQLLNNYNDSPECLHYLWTSIRENKKANPYSLAIIISSFLKTIGYTLKLYSELLTNNISAAIKTQQTLIIINPDNTSGFHKLATYFMHDNQPILAKTALEEILIFNQQNTKALSQLAKLYFVEKNFQKATTCAKALLSINPNQLEAENILKNIAALGVIQEGFDNITPAS